MKIRNKLSVSVMMIILGIGIVITTIWYRHSEKLSDKYLRDVSESTMKYAYNAFEYLLTDTEYMATLIATNENNIVNPVETLSKNSSSLMKNGQWTREFLDNGRRIEEYIKGMYGYKYYIAGIAVSVTPDQLFSAGQSVMNKDDLNRSIARIDTEDLRYSMVMLDPVHVEGLKSTDSSDYIVPAVRGIVGRDGTIIGAVVLYFDYGVIEQIFSANLPAGSYFQVLNRQGAEIFSSNKAQMDELKMSRDYMESRFLARDVGWEFYMGIPADIYMSEINRTAMITGIVIMIIIGISIVISVAAVSGMTHEITVLKENMSELANGNLHVRYQVRNGDEIGMMGMAFNDMAFRITELMERVANEERQKRMNEMAFLQAQINPHFISNVLNRVIWMAKMHHADNLIPLVVSLNRLLYSAMREERHMIPLEDELQYVDVYITMMESGGNCDLTVEKQIEEGTGLMMIPRFILQPIVENAICHGLGRSLRKRDRLRISSATEGRLLYITVEDNGCGMTREEMRGLFQRRKNSRHSFNGIGVRNVNERIRLFSGDAYGITYESVPGQYTKCIFKLPIVEDTDESAEDNRGR